MIVTLPTAEPSAQDFPERRERAFVAVAEAYGVEAAVRTITALDGGVVNVNSEAEAVI